MVSPVSTDAIACWIVAKGFSSEPPPGESEPTVDTCQIGPENTLPWHNDVHSSIFISQFSCAYSISETYIQLSES